MDSWKKKIADQDAKLKVPTNAPRKPSLVDRNTRDSSAKENIKTAQSIQETLTHAINLPDSDEETALSLAVTNKHKDVVTILLGAGADVGIKTRGSNALHRAICEEDSGVFSLLLAKAAEKDVNALNDSNNTPLMEAIEKEAWDDAVALLELDTSKFKLLLEEKYSDERTALGLASWKGEEKVVQLLLKRGASRKATDENGDTPLHEACWKGHLDIALLLMDTKSIPTGVEGKNGETSVESKDEAPNAKFNKDQPGVVHKMEEASGKPKEDESGEDPKTEAPGIDPRNKAGKTPLFYAAMRGQDAVVEMLLTKGANADEKDDSNESILGCAARSDEEDAFMHILNGAADINVADKSEQTPLLWLMRRNMEKAATALLAKDHVDIETHPDNLLSPLHEATRRCSVSVIDLLLSKTDNALETDSQGRTALHIAAAFGRLEVLKFLLNTKHKRKPLFEKVYDDKQGRNVLHHAACSGTLEVVEFLLQDPDGEAVINKPDKNGWTALHWAAKSGNEEVFAQLLAHGADPNLKETLNNETVLQLLQRYSHKLLAQALPNLALQHGKPIDEDIKSRPVGNEWGGVSCDGCYSMVSLQHYLLKRYLTGFLCSQFEELASNVKTVKEFGKGLIFARNAKSQVPRPILDILSRKKN